MGEFIFDQQWAEAAYMSGIQYYPKLLVAVPYTPAAGARILVKPSIEENLKAKIIRSVGNYLKTVAEKSGLSSVHVNFCSDSETEALKNEGFYHRKSLQYHWKNKKYLDFSDYLNDFPSKRRIKIKRERRSVTDTQEGGVTLKIYRGNEISEDLLSSMYKIYKTTIDKNPYGRLYLNEQFFLRLNNDFKKNLCFICAEKEGKIFGGTFNVVKADRFYGRYWGTHKFVKNLHFEACYYKSIEYCIENGLQVMEPGAGGGDFKFLRGFDPVVVNSVHFCSNRGLGAAIERFVKQEAIYIDEAAEELGQRSYVNNKNKQ